MSAVSFKKEDVPIIKKKNNVVCTNIVPRLNHMNLTEFKVTVCAIYPLPRNTIDEEHVWHCLISM